jgi:hypothetical protein
MFSLSHRALEQSLMKPRFSILTLLAGTAFIAAAVAALVRPISVWPNVVLVAWLLAMASFLVTAIASVDASRRTFARCVIGCAVFYLLITFIGNDFRPQLPHKWASRWLASKIAPIEIEYSPYVVPYPGRLDLSNQISTPGDEDSLAFLETPTPIPLPANSSQPTPPTGVTPYLATRAKRPVAPQEVERVLFPMTALAFGLLGGCLAIWRMHAEQRRDNSETLHR